MSLILGDSVDRTVQHIVGMAWAHRTPEAMQEAIARIQGVRTLLTFMGPGNERDQVALGNEILNCRLAADKLRRGEL